MHEYLTFILAEETCAVPIDNVESVLEWSRLTAIPGSPEYVSGLLNLRGVAVPVVDVRRKLRLDATEHPERSNIIVMSFEYGEKRRLVGALVDSVCEVIEIAPSEIDPVDDFAVNFDSGIVKGIGKKGDQFISVMAADKIFANKELLELDMPA